VIVGVVNFLSTFIALWFIDRSGRKKLMMVGAIGMVVALVAASSIWLVHAAAANGTVLVFVDGNYVRLVKMLLDPMLYLTESA
jgi:SP family xylose:H+ symportor-like MFS transporter